MLSSLKALLITGSLAAAILGAAVPVAVATAAPAVAHPRSRPRHPSHRVTVPDAHTDHIELRLHQRRLRGRPADLHPGSVCNGNNFLMSVVSGSLPPGLQLDEQFNINYWTIWGTLTQAGTYAFTVQVTPWDNNAGGIVGPSGTQQLTITIGTGHSDRPLIRGPTGTATRPRWASRGTTPTSARCGRCR